MKKSRIKIKLAPSISSRDEAEMIVGDIALITIRQTQLTAKMDAEIAAVRQRYEGNLAALAEGLKIKTDTLRVWAEGNPDQFPPKRKSIQFTQGTIGFRTGTPTLVLLNRSWTWAKVMESIKQWHLDTMGFIRNKPEVAKDFILAANSTSKDPQQHAEGVLKPLGLKIAQEESFFVEPDLTPVETRQVTETQGRAA